MFEFKKKKIEYSIVLYVFVVVVVHIRIVYTSSVAGNQSNTEAVKNVCCVLRNALNDRMF